jgi:trehalose/maltose hydrolase-like predicted phosphorylase
VHSRVLLAVGTLTITAAAFVTPPPGSAQPPAAAHTGAPSGAGSFVLTATHRGKSYAPAYTGNGYLGVRVPPAGQGYAGGTVPAQSEVAGFYAQPSGDVQQRANLPTWSTLRFDGFSLRSGNILRWRQQLDLHDGVITTVLRWRAPDGRVSDLRYQVFTDRARTHVGVVRLTVVPRWTGRATVTDLIDGKPATLTTAVTRSRNAPAHAIAERVRTVGTGLTAGLNSRVAVQGAGSARVSSVNPQNAQSTGQRYRFQVRSGHRYSVTKYVGIATSNDAARPSAVARRQSEKAAKAGFAALRTENGTAWSRLWRGRIDVQGKPALATEVNASEFYLWASAHNGVNWSVSPAGLSSNGYDGHIFWDAETWMHPALLAQHSGLAAAMDAYRFHRLRAAIRHARQTGHAGARYPWESALDGTEQIPPPVSVNSEGLYEQHITADIALAQWQYYLTTGDRHWLRTRGWPVLKHAAVFWASRAVQSSNGHFHIRHVTGPDEENPDVNDEAYTNVAAAKTLRIAAAAGAVLGRPVPGPWRHIARGLVLLHDAKQHIHPEFRGYKGQLVKQADVTMLQYPWGRAMARKVAQNDLNYYVPRSDPGGPSMSDAINNIDTAALGSPGCAAYVYTQRSILPFMRDVLDQFSETRTGGAFTFMTGIGGFLQEFLDGYSGLRMGQHAVSLDPMINGRLSGVVLHRIVWHDRQFTVAVGDRTTRVTLDGGAALPVTVRGVRHVVRAGQPLTISTRRPDLRATSDVLRCAHARATNSASGAIPLAAVDGSPATDWQPRSLPATWTVALRAAHTIQSTTVRWGRMWPGPPGPNIPPPPGPVVTLRPRAYDLMVSKDGQNWHTVARVHSKTTRIRDVLTFPAVPAKYVRLRVIRSPSGAAKPMLDEVRAN